MKKEIFLIFSILTTGLLILPTFCFASTEIYIRNFDFITTTQPIYNLGSTNFFWKNVYAYDCEGEIATLRIKANGETTSVDVSCESWSGAGLNLVIAGEITGKSVETNGKASVILEGVFFNGENEGNFGGIFTFPTNALASSTAYIGDLITDAGPFIWLAIGIPLGFVVIRRFIKIMPKK